MDVKDLAILVRDKIQARTMAEALHARDVGDHGAPRRQFDGEIEPEDEDAHAQMPDLQMPGQGEHGQHDIGEGECGDDAEQLRGWFDALAEGPVPEQVLQVKLGLASRPWAVLATAIRALRLMEGLPGQPQAITPMGRFLLPGGEHEIRGYVGLTSGLPGVRAMMDLLRADKPVSNRPDEGKAFIFREGMDSAMESGDSARRLTMALAGRAFICAPVLADVLPLDGVGHLVDHADVADLFAGMRVATGRDARWNVGACGHGLAAGHRNVGLLQDGPLEGGCLRGGCHGEYGNEGKGQGQFAHGTTVYVIPAAGASTRCTPARRARGCPHRSGNREGW